MFLSRTATSMKFVCKGVCVRTALILAQLTCLSSTSLPPNVEALPPRTGSLITVLHQREYHSPTPDDSNLLSSVRLPLALKGGGVAPKKSSQRKDTVLTFEAASEHCSGQSLLVVGMGLRTIHSGVSQLEGISKLDLSNNSLSDLGGVRSIEGVRWLQAKHNRVTTTRTVRGMTELRVLNLGHNRLATLDGLSTLKQLRAVLLNNNELAGALSLPSLPFLSSLILSHNKIENIEGGSGENLPQLRKMSLSHNQLTSLPDLSSIPTLQEVRGAYNSVSEIPNWIRSCHALKVLDLGHNAIAVLDAGAAVALRGCMSLQNLNLAGNPVCETGGDRKSVV